MSVRLSVNERDIRTLQGMLRSSGFVESYGQDDTIETFTAKFEDGYEADIKVCNGDPPYVDAVLFDPSGCEVKVLELSSVILGEYRFDDIHIVTILQT